VFDILCMWSVILLCTHVVVGLAVASELCLFKLLNTRYKSLYYCTLQLWTCSE